MSSARRPLALAFDDVSFAYPAASGGASKLACAIVRDVTLRVAAGEMVGLLGPNGAGKSTLLKLATGIIQPQAGRIRVEGDELRRLRREEIARRIAVVPQDFAVQFAYTVRQVVELGRTSHLGAWGTAGQADRAAVEAALATTGCAGLADRVFNDLSGGERQRVVIALALAQQPHILLLDEPTAHLDIRYQIETLALVRRLNRRQGLTVVATMHDLNLAARYFPRLLLFDGSVMADGAPTHVLDATTLGAVYRTPVRVGVLPGDERLSVTPTDETLTDVPLASSAPPDNARAGGAASHDRLTDGAPGEATPAGMASAMEGASGPAETARPIAAHLIGGCGAASLLMRALADADMPFTIGPVNIGDSDYALAQRLAATCLVEPPFAAVSPDGLAAAREHMAAARAVIVCPTPLGPGNIELLDAALAVRQAGTPVALLTPDPFPHRWEGEIERAPVAPAPPPSHTGGKGAGGLGQSAEQAITARDFSGRGVPAYRALAAAGAVWVRGPGEALAWLAGETQ